MPIYHNKSTKIMPYNTKEDKVWLKRIEKYIFVKQRL